MLERLYNKWENSKDFQGFRCEGYLPDIRLSGQDSDEIAMEAVPPFLRTLIVTDGTVTKSLEAYYWERVKVDTLYQESAVASHDINWLGVQKGEQVLNRQVHLRGEASGKIYTTAFSVIRQTLIPEDLRNNLLNGKIGIGVLIRECGLETYREIVDVGVDKMMGYIDAKDIDNPELLSFVYRIYRIYIDHKPVILISENFPWDIYKA